MALNKIKTTSIEDDSITSVKIAPGAVTITDIPDGEITMAKLSQVDLTIAPEVLEIQVDAPAAGQDTAWLWTWEQSTLPYARRTITNSPEVSVPLYKQGTYTVNNYAAYDLHGSMTQTHSLYLKWIDGAGTDNLVSWAVDNPGNPVSDSHPDINGGSATDVQRIAVNVPATITIPTLNAPSVSYTVTNNGAGAYTFSGSASGDNPNIGPFYRGGTYTFNVSASGHPFYLTTDNGTNFSAGTYFGEYTSGVTGSRTDSGTITFVVPSNAPDTLYYQCGNHSAMRGAITIKDLAVETNINGNYVVYFQHTQEGHKTPIELRPIPSLVNQMCLVYDSTSGKFVPQDLATYVENTPSFENKIREVAGTAELVVEDGSAVVAKVNVYDDSTYLPLTGNNPGDQAFATDTDILYIWDGSAWQQAGASNSDDLTEGTTNLFYTDARVANLIVGGNNITATYDGVAGTLTLDGQPGYTDTDVGNYLTVNGYQDASTIIASITDSAPATLDTLNELAAALGDDPNFATTTANSIALKAPIDNPTLTGTATTDILVSQLHLQETSIPTGTTYTIPSGKQVVVESLDIIGDLDVQGTLATVSGGSLTQTTMKTQAITHTNGTSAITIDTNGNITSNNVSANGNLYVGANGTAVPDSNLAPTLDFLQVGSATFLQAGTDAQAFIKSNNYWNGAGTSIVDTNNASTTVRLNENNAGIIQFESGPSGGAATSPRLIINQNSTNGQVVIQNRMDNGYEALKLESFNDYDAQMSFRSNGTNSYWWGMGIDNSDGGAFKMGADNLLGVNNRFRIGQDGVMTTPYQPHFRVSSSQSGSGSYLHFNNVHTNIGGHWNNSTDRFTAPVDGVYQFNFAVLHTNSSSYYARVNFVLNGNTGGKEALGDTLEDWTGSYHSSTASLAIYLSANDYIQLYCEGTPLYQSGNYASFSGFLAG